MAAYHAEITATLPLFLQLKNGSDEGGAVAIMSESLAERLRESLLVMLSMEKKFNLAV